MLCTKKEKDHLLSAHSSKACLTDGMGVNYCQWHKLHHIWKRLKAQTYICVLEQHILTNRKKTPKTTGLLNGSSWSHDIF